MRGAFLTRGFTDMDFWALSLDEIYAYYEAWANKDREDLRHEIIQMFNFADLIGNRIAHVLVGDEAKLIDRVVAYPKLFEDELRESPEKQMAYAAEQADTRRNFAAKWNKKFRNKHNE